MTKHTVLTTLTAASTVAVMAACSGPGTSSSSSSSSKLPAGCSSSMPAMGVALPNTVNPYYVAMRRSFEKNGKAAGFDVKVAIANDSDSNQLAQVQSFIQQGVCLVALNAVSSDPGAAQVNLLTKAGVPVFTINIDANCDQVERGGGAVVEYVGADQKAGGAVMAKAALEDHPSTPIVAGIAGEPDQNVTVDRVDAFKSELTKLSPESKVVAAVDTNVDPQVALQKVTEMLQGNPSINVVFADTGPAAVGSIQAIKQLGLVGKVSLYAFCAADTALDDQVYRGCSAQLPTEYAKVLSENAAKYIKGHTVAPVVNLPVKVFTEGQRPGPDELG